MTDVQPETIVVQVGFGVERGLPLSTMVEDLDDVLEVLDFALFLSHGDAVRWEHGGGRGQVRLVRLETSDTVAMTIDLVMSGGLGLSHAETLAGVTVAESALRTAAETTALSIRDTDKDAENRVIEALERVAYAERGTDLAWRIREAEDHITTSPEGVVGKGSRLVRSASRLVRKPEFTFTVER